MKTQILQIGEQGADIEMHVAKNPAGMYFVHFFMFKKNRKGERVPAKNAAFVQPFNSKEEVYEKYGKMMAGKTISI